MDDNTNTQECTALDFVQTFNSDHGRKVLAYLADFAAADSADFINDIRKSDYIQGRRSVVLEIRSFLTGGKQNG